MDYADEAIRACLTDTATKVLGTKIVGGTLVREDPTVERLRQLRFRDMEKAPAVFRPMCAELYYEAKQRWREAAEEYRRKEFEQLHKNIERMDASELSKSLRHLARKHLKVGGTRLNSDEDSMEESRRFFENQFRRRSDTRGPQLQPAALQWRGHLIPRGRILEAMKCCGNGKAPGRTGFRAELFKVSAEHIVEPIRKLLQMCLELGVVPSAWKEANILPIPKKAGATRINEHRPISLTEHIRKLFEKTILPEVIRTVEPLGREQGGFRTKRSTLDQAAALHEILTQERKKKKRIPVVAYLDVTAAYDSVPRDILGNQMQAKGVTTELLRVLQALFDDCTSRVIIGGKESGTLQHACGLLQGSSLSPVLYSLYINGVAAKARETATVP